MWRRGACTTVEHHSEKDKQYHNLIRFLQTRRGIPFNKMFAMKEYPQDVLPLYAQGFSVTRYLIQQGGKPHFVNFVADGLQSNNWPAAVQKFYGYRDLSDLQVKWNSWVAQGSPPIQRNNPAAIADAGNRAGNPIARGQSPETYDQLELEAGRAASLTQSAPQNGLRWRTRGQNRGVSRPSAAPNPATTGPQSTARQQSPQQPRTRILEWSAQPAPATALGNVSAQPAAQTSRSIYDRTSGSKMR